MEKLVKNSIRIYPGIIAVYPQFCYQEEALFVSEQVPKFNGMYNTNNSTVAYCYNDEFYCTPISREAIRTLERNGFVKGDLPVPFSNSFDYPKKEKKKWDELKEMARREREELFQGECISYSKKHGIGELPQEVLDKCVEMPDKGVLVLWTKAKKLPYRQTYYPILRSILGVTDVERIGRYSKNNGVVIFVYQNGKTMLTRGYNIISKLQEAGYREAGLNVPFSNNEEILDPEFKAKWEAIKK